ILSANLKVSLVSGLITICVRPILSL
ncbi:uncharacterized protein METZ01_LOCUS449336, partial [marine metagenome]